MVKKMSFCVGDRREDQKYQRRGPAYFRYLPGIIGLSSQIPEDINRPAQCPADIVEV